MQSKNQYTCVYVNVPTYRLRWGDPEQDKFIPWHWIHYGFPNKKHKNWTSRDT